MNKVPLIEVFERLKRKKINQQQKIRNNLEELSLTLR